MQIIDVILELLETGKKFYCQAQNEADSTSLGAEEEALGKFVQLINQMVGYDRSEVVYAYFEGRISQKNAILRLVVDEPKEAMTETLASIAITESQKAQEADVISIRSKRGRRDIYDEHSCIEALLKASAELGNYFTKTEYVEFTKKHQGLPSAWTVIKYIGKNTTSWRRILMNAGINRIPLKAAK